MKRGMHARRLSVAALHCIYAVLQHICCSGIRCGAIHELLRMLARKHLMRASAFDIA